MKFMLLYCILLSSLSVAWTAQILAVLPFPGKSHFIFNNAVMSALAERGHNVTVYSAFSPPSPIKNMKHIKINTDFEAAMKKSWSFDKFAQFSKQKSYFGLGSKTFWKMAYPICEEFNEHKKIQKLIASKEKFDLVLVEVFFGYECTLPFGHLFKAPVVNLNAFGTWNILNRVHGNDLPIASYPSVSFPFTNDMDFVERFRNFVSTVGSLLYYYFYHLPKQNEIIQRVFKDPKMPPVQDMVTNISLTLVNSHPMVGYPQTYSPNIVPIGGVHISEKVDPLPKDIQEFMDRGKHAVIFFSLGSLVPIHLMKPEDLQMFVNVFRRLPYQVLWKIELDSIPNLSDNVKTSKWLPQQAVLAHPNCVLFITHGGLHSQMEAFHAGVPVVGIPMFGDQPHNVRLYEHLGVGVGIDFGALSEESLYKAVTSIAGKPQFMENAKKVSALFRHQQTSPADTAVFWIEYVLRHGHSHHLRPRAAMLPWYSLFLVDVLAAILAVLVTVLLLVCKCLSLFCGQTSKQPVPAKKKKN